MDMILDQIPAREWRDLAIAWLGTSIAFVPILEHITGQGIAQAFIISLLTVGIAFVTHECAHKFMAIREGYWAEFRRNDLMIILAVVMGWTLGMVIAAPGAATIYPRGNYGGAMTRGELGRSAAAGPVSNIVLCVIFLLMVPLGGFMGTLGTIGATINALFALFNMIPFGPFDGKKVLDWNMPYFAAIAGMAFVLFLVTL